MTTNKTTKKNKTATIVTGEKGAKQVEEVINKEKKIDADSPSKEQLEFARINMRKNFNERFSKWAIIEPEDADDAYIAEAKKELEDAVETQKAVKYKIADPEDGLALKTAEFLKTWNENFNHWEKGSWRGVIRFNIVIDKHIAELKADDKKPLEIDYQTLIFLHNSMMTPSGMGLASARKMAEFENYNEETDGPLEENIPVTYSSVLIRINEHVANLRAIDKKLNILQQKLQLAYAGLRMTLKISELEEFVEFCDVITNTNVAENTDEVVSEAEKKEQ